MSDWEFPTLAPPQYLDKKIQATSESDLKFYSSELGLTNNLKRITPNIKLSGRSTGPFSIANIPAPFTDPPIVRSEAWSSLDFIKSSKKRRWAQFKSNFVSCIKSVKCRFTALGLLLGLILSLGALIPIVIMWQTSGSKSNTTLSPSITGVGSSLVAFTSIGPCSNSYFCEEQVIFITNMTVTALSLIVTIERTGNTTYSGAYSTYPGSINSTYTTSTTEIIFTFFIAHGTLPAGNYTCAVQFSLPGLNHTASSDQYSISVTNICGIITSASGKFQ